MTAWLKKRDWVLCLLLPLTLAASAGCSKWQQQEMRNQPKYRAYEASEIFPDRAAARPVIKGTVPREYVHRQRPLYVEQGTEAALSSIPVPITGLLVKQGQEQFNVFCSPCHGREGRGDGEVPKHGFEVKPPSFHLPRLQSAPAGHYYQVIKEGKGKMFSYAARVAPAERWAVTAYIRVLQGRLKPDSETGQARMAGSGPQIETRSQP